MESLIREIFAHAIQESWTSESGIQLKIEYGIQVPRTKSLDSSTWIRNPWRGIQNARLSWISFTGQFEYKRTPIAVFFSFAPFLAAAQRTSVGRLRDTKTPMKPWNLWHHEPYETTRPLTPRNLWNHEIIDTTKPMKPWDPWHHETYETMKTLTPRNLWNQKHEKMKPSTPRNLWNHETIDTTKPSITVKWPIDNVPSCIILWWNRPFATQKNHLIRNCRWPGSFLICMISSPFFPFTCPAPA